MVLGAVLLIDTLAQNNPAALEVGSFASSLQFHPEHWTSHEIGRVCGRVLLKHKWITCLQNSSVHTLFCSIQGKLQYILDQFRCVIYMNKKIIE